ncbi:MAG: hypothetical protein ABIH23_14530 [bacterium]
MTEAEYISAVLARPPVMQWKADDGKKRDAIKPSAGATFARLVSLFPWPFATGRATEPTVADQSEYTLKGNASDAASIVNIKYGTGKKLLERWDENALDDMISDASTTNDDGSTETTNITEIPRLWVPYGEENTFPRVKIHGTPTTVQTMYYRYFKKNLEMVIWPDQWRMVLFLNIEADLFGSGAPFNSDLEYRSDPHYFNDKAEEVLNDMIAQYERTGGEESPAPLGRAMRARFTRRSNQGGF